MSQPDGLSGEFAFIHWIRGITGSDSRVPIGIGDDAAALRWPSPADLLVTTDMILEGVHFDRTTASAYQIGRKAMAVNLSDIAAMAGVPTAAVASVGLPSDFPRVNAEQLFRGLYETAMNFEVALVGGDTNRSLSGVVISVTLIGAATDRGPVPRSGARPGDWILVTGSLGGSILGKHLDFTPRVREALALHAKYDLHAMIDVSDGLASDLNHIVTESRCGATIFGPAVPISNAARTAPSHRSPLERALYDGEDFELLFTLPPDDASRLLSDRALNVPVTHIGVVESEPGLSIESSGSRDAIVPAGFDHFCSRGES